ncbi:hypothetical protein M2238_002192 [Bradyrhizobium elkanii]|nr:hypothetical protein [Bradyrhizobium elkanii]
MDSNMTDWKCSGCGVPTPNRVRCCNCPTNCISDGQGNGAWKIEAGPSKLAETIRTKLLGVRPEDQDVVLEDSDWRLILTALAAL